MVDDVRQYGSAQTILDRLPYTPANAYSEFDQVRLQTYALCEDLYNNCSESFNVLVRSDDDDDVATEIYVPNARKVVEATSRYLGIGFSYEIEPKSQSVDEYIKKFWEREALDAKFISQKRWGLVRGDAVWLLTADEDKDVGSRMSIHEVDPSQYFPIQDPDDPMRRIGCYLVDEWDIPDESKGEKCARVQQWTKEDDGTVTYQSGLWKTGKWDEREMEKKDLEFISWLEKPKTLPKEISQLPVYHIRIRPPQNGTFGKSLISGVETMFLAINQAITDEELSLSIAGLGFYMTDGGPPRDESGNPVDWEIGPLRVVEVGQGKKFDRVSGVSSVEPSQKHIEYLESSISQSTGVPDIAMGIVDTAVAESGISLAFKLGPILASNAEIELEMKSVMNQMFHDMVHQWLPTYESVSAGEGVSVKVVFGDPRPQDTNKRFDQILMLVEAKLMSPKTAIKELNKIGWEISEGDFDEALEATKKIGQASDPFGSSMSSEASGSTSDNQQNG